MPTLGKRCQSSLQHHLSTNVQERALHPQGLTEAACGLDRNLQAIFLLPYRGPEGRPTAPLPPESQSKSQSQERAARFSAWETDTISVTGSAPEESSRPRFESQLCPLPRGETLGKGYDLQRLLPHPLKEVRRQRQGQTPLFKTILQQGHWKPQAPGDMLCWTSP